MADQACASRLQAGGCNRYFRIASSLCGRCHPRRSCLVSTLASPTQRKANLHSMSPHKDRIRIWVLLHSLLETLPEVLFVCGVFDDGNPQPVVVT
jgi:hypothetical protein